jgi:hypothetical protein
MKYFNSFQKVITTDYNNNAILLTNLIQRVEVIPSLLQNPLVFYSYDVQESDTPEIVADKYYGDPYRYWLVLFANQITDPQWQWPLTSQQFSLYLNDKYSAAAGNTSVLSYTQGTISQYNKTITTTDSITSNTTSVTLIIDQPTYLATQTGTTTQTFSDGSSVTETISKNILSIYDYETQLNESKRNIQIINKKYASDFEKQLVSLLGM